MTQTTVLAAAQTAATSSDVIVAPGIPVTVGIFADTGNIPAAVIVDLCIDTPGADNLVYKFTAQSPTVSISGAGTYRAYRRDISALGVNVGVYKET